MNKATLAAILTMIFMVSSPCGAFPSRADDDVVKVQDPKKKKKSADTEIKVDGTSVVIETKCEVEVRIYTIIGRLVSSAKIQPGTARLPLPAHGIYIVRLGDETTKVAV